MIYQRIAVNYNESWAIEMSLLIMVIVASPIHYFNTASETVTELLLHLQIISHFLKWNKTKGNKAHFNARQVAPDFVSPQWI